MTNHIIYFQVTFSITMYLSVNVAYDEYGSVNRDGG